MHKVKIELVYFPQSAWKQFAVLANALTRKHRREKIRKFRAVETTVLRLGKCWNENILAGLEPRP